MFTMFPPGSRRQGDWFKSGRRRYRNQKRLLLPDRVVLQVEEIALLDAKEGEARGAYHVTRWRDATGADLASPSADVEAHHELTVDAP